MLGFYMDGKASTCIFLVRDDCFNTKQLFSSSYCTYIHTYTSYQIIDYIVNHTMNRDLKLHEALVQNDCLSIKYFVHKLMIIMYIHKMFIPAS